MNVFTFTGLPTESDATKAYREYDRNGQDWTECSDWAVGKFASVELQLSPGDRFDKFGALEEVRRRLVKMVGPAAAAEAIRDHEKAAQAARAEVGGRPGTWVNDDGTAHVYKRKVKAKAGDEATVADPHEDALMERVFGYSEVTRHVLDQARARQIGPWAALFLALGQAALLTPWWVRLPAIVGGRPASLNTITALVGLSGGGKSNSTGGGGILRWEVDPLTLEGASLHEGEDQCPRRILTPQTVGSGEAISTLFRDRRLVVPEPDENGKTGKAVSTQVLIRRAAWIDFAEVDHFLSLIRKDGSSLSPELRKFTDGAALGVHTKSTDRRSFIDAFTYRGIATVSVQPARAGIILEGADGGLPQRFVWVATDDPNATADGHRRPALAIRLPSWGTPEADEDDEPAVYVHVDDSVRRQVVADRIKALRREDGALVGLDSHRNLVRLKLAAAVAVLHGRTSVTELEWDLAEGLMEHSDRVRAGVQNTLRSSWAEEQRRRGAGDAAREEGKAAAREAAIRKAADSITAWMERQDGPVTPGQIAASGKSGSPRRVYRDEALALLVDEGVIRKISGDDVDRYALVAEQKS
ncbi:hypothetical protein [Rhodococcus pyridinivorans]|uniref:hypothetical protein n=1 Tax=Rhodococcus pyridinivorans TaxID=103816 RepID=UPI002283FF81|nr:hypothetical protein [Rhodococcus pyridinivorans]WAL48415.1 hypothetical protein OQN32_10280 [Rhodococcus pyridinivorans]